MEKQSECSHVVTAGVRSFWNVKDVSPCENLPGDHDDTNYTLQENIIV